MPESIIEQIENQFSARISTTESVGSVDFQQILLTKVTRLGNRFSLIGCHFLYQKSLGVDLIYMEDKQILFVTVNADLQQVG